MRITEQLEEHLLVPDQASAPATTDDVSGVGSLLRADDLWKSYRRCWWQDAERCRCCEAHG